MPPAAAFRLTVSGAALLVIVLRRISTISRAALNDRLTGVGGATPMRRVAHGDIAGLAAAAAGRDDDAVALVQRRAQLSTGSIEGLLLAVKVTGLERLRWRIVGPPMTVVGDADIERIEQPGAGQPGAAPRRRAAPVDVDPAAGCLDEAAVAAGGPPRALKLP